MAFDCKDYDTAFRKSLKAKKAAEGTAEPALEGTVPAAMPTKPVEIVKLPSPEAIKELPSAASCAKCGTEARDDDNFCAKCGSPIVRKRLCSQCGAELSPDDLFCRKCGAEAKTQ